MCARWVSFLVSRLLNGPSSFCASEVDETDWKWPPKSEQIDYGDCGVMIIFFVFIIMLPLTVFPNKSGQIKCSSFRNSWILLKLCSSSSSAEIPREINTIEVKKFLAMLNIKHLGSNWQTLGWVEIDVRLHSFLLQARLDYSRSWKSFTSDTKKSCFIVYVLL